MKKGEDMFCDVKSEYISENDKYFCEKYGIDIKENLVVDAMLYSSISVDYFWEKDALKTNRMILKKGETGKRANRDSTVECIISCVTFFHSYA